MGDSLLCHYIDNCFKKGIILWGQKHCDWGGKVEEWGHFPPVPMLKKALAGIPVFYQTVDCLIGNCHFSIDMS